MTTHSIKETTILKILNYIQGDNTLAEEILGELPSVKTYRSFQLIVYEDKVTLILTEHPVWIKTYCLDSSRLRIEIMEDTDKAISNMTDIAAINILKSYPFRNPDILYLPFEDWKTKSDMDYSKSKSQYDYEDHLYEICFKLSFSQKLLVIEEQSVILEVNCLNLHSPTL